MAYSPLRNNKVIPVINPMNGYFYSPILQLSSSAYYMAAFLFFP